MYSVSTLKSTFENIAMHHTTSTTDHRSNTQQQQQQPQQHYSIDIDYSLISKYSTNRLIGSGAYQL